MLSGHSVEILLEIVRVWLLYFKGLLLNAIVNLFIFWFTQGRALLNAVGNLELKDEYSEALHKLGHDLEAVAEQVWSTASLFRFSSY